MCVCVNVYVCIYVCGEQDILYVYILCVCMCFPLTPFKMQEFIVLPCYWFFFEMIVSGDVRVSQTLSTCSSLTELNLSDNQVLSSRVSFIVSLCALGALVYIIKLFF